MDQCLCPLPWLSLSTKTNGRGRTCGYAVQSTERGAQLEDMWNSEYWRGVRSQMRRGERPANCATCFNREDQGGLSRRLKELKAWQHQEVFQQALSQTEEDGTLPLGPVLLDLRTGSGCNLKCVNCFPTNSRKWLEDKALLNKYENTKTAEVQSVWEDQDGAVWDYIKNQSSQLRGLSFLGGEPLFSKTHDKVMELLLERQATHVHLKYVTNGMLLRPSLIEKWNRFEAVHLMVSLDDLGARGEFLRFPLKWHKYVENVQLLEQMAGPQVKLQFLFTCNNLNIGSIPEVVGWTQNYPRFELVMGAHVNYPTHLHPQNLPVTHKFWVERRLQGRDWGFWQKDVDFYMRLMRARDLWPSRGSTLLNYLDDLDRARGTQWREIFPELVNQTAAVGILHQPSY